MATTTSNLGLTKPAYTDAADVGVLNGNFDLIDQAIAKDRVNNVRYTNVHNLLDNSDFTNPVNQRGGSSYSASGYTIDRWRKSSSETVIALNNQYVSIANSATSRRAFEQPLEHNYIGKTLTVAVKDYDTQEVYCSSVTVPDVTTEQQYLESVQFNGHSARLSLTSSGMLLFQVMVAAGGTVNLEWAALYEGEYTAETLPPYIPKGYAHELMECMRYYQTLHILGSASSSSVGAPSRFFFPLPVKMRVSPTHWFTQLDPNGVDPHSLTSDRDFVDLECTTGVSNLIVYLSADL